MEFPFHEGDKISWEELKTNEQLSDNEVFDMRLY